MLNKASQTKRLSGRAQRMLERKTAPMISTPPIVGVPCLPPCNSASRWTSTARRIGWPNLSAVSLRMTKFPKMSEMTNAMTAHRFLAELAHFAENGDPFSIGIEFNQRAQGRFHRIRIRVVAIIDELYAVNFFDLQTRLGQRRGGKPSGAFLKRKTKDATGRDSQHGVLHHVQTWHGQLRAAAMRSLVNGKIRSVRALCNFTGANRPGGGPGKNHFGARASGNLFRKRIVRI